jgi:hypothetical protein
MRRMRLVVVPLIAFSFLGLPPTAFAQGTAWVDQFGTESFEEAWGPLVVGTTVYVSGWTEGTLPGQTRLGRADGFLRAYDLDGAPLWTVQFGTTRDDRAWSLATDGTGLYVTGYTNGTFPGQTRSGGDDAFVAKFDLDGSVQWVSQFGTGDYDLGSNVVADGTGVYVVGSTRGAFPGQASAGGYDVFHARLDAEGNVDTVVQFGSRKDDYGHANAIGPSGVYVNGYTLGRMGQKHRGGWDAFVALLSTDDTMTWLRQFGTPGFDLGFGLVADAVGAYVTGETSGRLKDQTDRGSNDAYARLLAANDGSTVWTRQFGTADRDVSYGATLADGVLYAIGTTGGSFGDQEVGEGDVFVQAMDPATGARTWTHQFGTAEPDTGSAGWVGEGAIYVVGFTRGAFPGFDAAGAADAFVARVDLP